MNLEDIVKEIDDVTEPASMENILMHLEELWEQDEEFMNLLRERVCGLEIYWDQPWYQRNICLTRPVKDDRIASEPYRMDTICMEENEIIEKNWKKFIKKYDLPDSLISIARWKNKGDSRNPKRSPIERARHFLISYLARGLERNLYQVFRHVMTNYGAPNKGIYTLTEMKIIEICSYHVPHKAVPYLSVVLGREPRNVYNRIQSLYASKPETKKMKWTLPMASKLLTSLLKHTEVPVKQLKNRKINKEVWLKVQEDMGGHYLYLQNFWYRSLHTQLFVKYDVKMKRLHKKLYKLISTYPYKVWTDIRWKEVVKELPDGFTSTFIYIVCYKSVCKLENYRRTPLKQLIDIVLSRRRKRILKRLRTLKYRNGQLNPIKYVEKLK